MTKNVWIFPGQGSQAVGMGLDLETVGKDKFAKAEQILGWSVLEKVQTDATELAKTQFTQPCLYVISAILTDILKTKGLSPHAVTGHSLGEYNALYCAGVIDFATGLELVKQRSLLMAEASGGAMTALIGFDRHALEAEIAATENVILANDNSADQVVISGTAAAVKSICERVKVKRAIPLAVSGAFHSPLMAEAAAKFAKVLEQTIFNDAEISVISNVEPNDATTSGQVLRDRLCQQMTSPVRWREICLYLAAQGYEQAIEVGSGKVLTGLVKRSAPSLALVNISTLEQAIAF
ncbi:MULTISPECIES: ACP S-malonyltransferase [Pseudanabaena]|uniref:Malonyl CoA-acyl carrier protein transacylase n=2 Tax=Pseudanabaena TaxID=1152 RepID=L8MUM5_9CYAN|nr:MULTISPECIES: ACP S-malonyltransferase [Pseudanabaena]ELS31166.1 malonyl CoA-acyl carrier protein transacylase [Pseudanabaena biceps PCC 7429]MDG3496576.1 ACP S-malonyltransferase [Pseudanabaena catenata USMAC16]